MDTITGTLVLLATLGLACWAAWYAWHARRELREARAERARAEAKLTAMQLVTAPIDVDVDELFAPDPPRRHLRLVGPSSAVGVALGALAASRRGITRHPIMAAVGGGTAATVLLAIALTPPATDPTPPRGTGPPVLPSATTAPAPETTPTPTPNTAPSPTVPPSDPVSADSLPSTPSPDETTTLVMLPSPSTTRGPEPSATPDPTVVPTPTANQTAAPEIGQACNIAVTAAGLDVCVLITVAGAATTDVDSA